MKRSLLIIFLLLTMDSSLLSQNISIKQKSQIPIQKKSQQKNSPQKNVLNDSDGDGISDDMDKCPYEKGNLKNEGCTDIQKNVIGQFQDNNWAEIMGLFGMKKIYESGKYTISETDYENIKSVYREFCFKVIESTKKHSDIKQIVNMKVVGYSDGKEIQNDSKLYNSLVQKSKNKVQNLSEAYVYLSELRAKNISEIIEELFIENINTGLNQNLKLNIEFIGKGEVFPNFNKSYKIDDETRRIVEVRWIVLPDKFLKD